MMSALQNMMLQVALVGSIGPDENPIRSLYNGRHAVPVPGGMPSLANATYGKKPETYSATPRGPGNKTKNRAKAKAASKARVAAGKKRKGK